MKSDINRTKKPSVQPMGVRKKAIAMLSLTLLGLNGCASINMARRAVQAQSSTSALPLAPRPAVDPASTDPAAKLVVLQEMVTDRYSNALKNCRALQADIFNGQITVNTTADIATTLLSGLAGFVAAPISVIRALAGGAAAVSGLKSTISNDVFGQQVAGFAGKELETIFFTPMKLLSDQWGGTPMTGNDEALKRMRDIDNLYGKCSLEAALASANARMVPLSPENLQAIVDAIKAAGAIKAPVKPSPN